MNSYSQKALLYFPTTVLFVDDNAIFLSSIGLKLKKDIPFALSDKPQEALDLLRNTPHVNSLTQKIMSELCAANSEGSMESPLLNLQQEIYNEGSYSCISTVVVDYSMPFMNGAEFCREIRDLPVKKIMLTGEADHQKAVELFNEGIIDYFIIKNSDTMYIELNEAIEKAQITYFEQASAVLLDYLRQIWAGFNMPDIKTIISTFGDKLFSEYYVLDASGSILFIDYEGKPIWLVIKSAGEIEAWHDIALNQDASQKVINRLKEKTAVPFFFTEEDYQIPATEWGGCLYDVAGLPGSGDRYFTIIDDRSIHPLANKVIHSRRDYWRLL